MPFLGIIVVVVLFMVLVASIIPLITSAIVIAILGKHARFDQESTMKLAVIFYAIMAFYFGMALAASNDASFIGGIFYMLLGLAWPLPTGYVFLGLTAESTQAWMLLAAAFVTTQLIAVIIILRRARAAAEQDVEL